MRKRSSRCPQCHSARVVPIRYGDPTKELMEAARREEIVLVSHTWSSGDGPTLHCLHCAYEWGGDLGTSSDSQSASEVSKARQR
jgi:hypothetical protein